MTAWYRLKMMTWSVSVVALVLWGLPAASQAEPVSVVTVAQIQDDDADERAAPNATAVEGVFADPFETEAFELVDDPWEPFNAKMFALNHRADIYLLRPAAKAYNAVIPPDVQDALSNVFYNAGFVSRLLNNVLQGKFREAGGETQRLLLNSTLGVGGLFDVATHMFGMEAPPREDTGQTMAVYGVPSGPYLVLPMMPPLTVRDAVGFVSDGFLDPVNYVAPFFVNIGVNAAERVNARSRNLETIEQLTAASVDLYGAARAAYLDRRAKDILE